MWRLPLFGFEHRFLVLAGAALLTAASWFALPGLRLDLSSDAVVAPGSPLHVVEQRIEDRFGRDEGAAVYAEDPALFTAERLAALRDIHDALSRLPFVERVEGLFGTPDLRDEDGAIVLGAPLAVIPAGPEALAARRGAILANPLLVGSSISADGQAVLLRVVFVAAGDAGATIDDGARHAAIERSLDPARQRFAHLFQLGGPATRATMLDRLKSDQRLILPATVVLLFVLLAIGLRSALLGLFPILNGALATIWGLAAMALLGVPVNLLNASLPVLVIVVGGMEDVRLTHEFRTCLRRHGFERLALFETTERVGLATLLNSVSTVIGFAATAASDLPVLRDFGTAAAIALALRVACTVFVLPAEFALSLGVLRAPAATAEHREERVSKRIAERVVGRLAPHVRLVVVALAILCGVGAAAAMLVPRDNDLLGFLGESDPFVQQVRRVESRLAGAEIINVEVDAAPGEFGRADALARLDGLTAALRALPGVDAAWSLSDVVARVHQELRAGDPGAGSLPATDRDVAQILLFADSRQIAPFVTPDRASARILVRTSIHDAVRLEELASSIGDRIDSGRFGRYVYAVGGRTLTVAGATDAITRGQVLSLGSVALILFGIVSIMFLSLRCGVVALLVNLAAVMMMFVLMGSFRVPLNIGTCMVASVTLGLVIDDTLHLLVRYNRALRVCRDESAGIKAALAEELGPMMAGAGALAGGFAMLGFSEFVPVRQFGLLSAAVIVIAVLTESVLSPVLFANTRIITLWDLLGLSLRRTLQEKSPLFVGLSRWQAKRLVLASDAARFRAGETIVRAGDPGSTMYVILEGDVEIVRRDRGEAHVVSRLGAGDVFGEVAFIAGVPRTANAVAAGDVWALVMSRESLESLRRFSPYLAAQLLLNLSTILSRRMQPADLPARPV